MSAEQVRTHDAFEQFITKELNKEQKRAVEHTEGPLLIIAGAGSGKTRVITARIAYLLSNKQVHPSEIVALTFTNKAAAEMKERIKSFLPEKSVLPFIGTFHAYCLYLLKNNSDLLPFHPFSLCDEDDKKAILTNLLKQSPLHKQLTAQQLSYQISLAKNQSTDLEQDGFNYFAHPPLHALFVAYEKEKQKAKCFDFDDLMLQALKLFENETFKTKHQLRVRHILIDEYQDTNVIQHNLLKHMGLNKNGLAVNSICAVGDEDQSIYSWRGATVDNIMHFVHDFKNTTSIKIEQNYRSKQAILTVANKVISNNTQRNEKNLWSDKGGRDCVRAIRCFSGYQEADIIARYAKVLQAHNRLSSLALLYRTHFQSRTLEEALIKHSIPYHLIGGIRFYERKEIKDIIAYLRLIVNPHDSIAFERVINCPLRGLGDVFIEEFMSYWKQFPDLDFKAISLEFGQNNLCTGNKKEALYTFVSFFNGLTTQSAAVETISNLVAKIDYLGFIKKQYEKEEAQERIDNITELINAAHFFANQNKVSIADLLDEISLLQEKSHEKEQGQAVTLMTLHAAKGLEFDNIIITGLEDQLFPSSRSHDTLYQLEEERRLFYVGITRARNKLLITHARYRQTYGQMEEVAPSRFLEEIPQDHCLFDNAEHWQPTQISSYFSQWLGYATHNPELVTFSSFIPTKKVETTFENQTPKTKRFAKHQTIKHPTFGIGIVQHIEEKQDKTIITAQFKSGVKKIDAQYLQSI